MEGMLMLLVMVLITVVLAWLVNGEQRKRIVSLLLCAAMMSSYIPAINFAKADSIAKPVLVNEQVLVNGVKSAQVGAVTYSASGSAYTIDTSSARVRVKNGDSISFEGAISAPEGETISWVRVDVYDANTEEPYTVGAEFYRASGMKVQEFDLASIPALTIGEAFGRKDYTLVEGGKYIVMFCVGDSNGNTFADMDADIEDDQGPAILVDVKLSPANCKHPHSDYRYVRHSSGETRKANYGDSLTHQVEPLYERYCGLCDTFLMNIWGQGTPEEHTINEYNVCMDCGYYAAPFMDMNMGIMPLSLDFDLEDDNKVLSIDVTDIIIGQSFKISWPEVRYADHYQISIVRIDKNGSGEKETQLLSQKDIGEDTSYTVPKSWVPEGTLRFRIYVGAAPTHEQTEWGGMLKSNTVTISARESKEKEMDVSIEVPGNVIISWREVTGADYYLYSVKNTTQGTYIADQKDTKDREVTINKSNIREGDKYIIWVSAYANSGENLAQHQVEMTLLVKCDHSMTMDKDRVGYYKYEDITDTHHTVYGIYDVVCKSCEKVLEKDLTKNLGKEEHDFSTEGVCTVCEYAGGECIHVNKVKEYTRTEYEPEDKNTHTRIKHFDLVCEYCEAVIPLKNTESYSKDRTDRTEGLNHNFVSGTCKDCGYVKAAELTITLQRGQASAVVGDTITASASIAGGSGTYQVIWKVYCDNTCVNDDITGAWISGLEHSASYEADRAGNWYFEAVVYDSEDESTSGKTQAITVSEPECEHDYQTVDQTEQTKYENVNDSQHRIVYAHASVCWKCQDVKNTWTSEAFEAHDFDADGTCICGAIEETDPDCAHGWNSTVSEVKVEETNRNDRMEKHMVTTIYADVCGKCGSEDSHETVEYVAHAFDKNGKCECGYIEVTEECDHATTGVPEGEPEYESLNNSVHSVTTYERHKCECGQVNELRSNTVEALHKFEDGFCICGLEEPVPECEHPTTDVAWDTTKPIHRTPVSDAEHSMSGYMYEYCTECFTHIGDSYAMTKNYPHDFDGAGDCPTCGYTKSCPHTETKFVPLDGYPAYHQHDEDEHIYDVQYKEVCANAACGKIVKNLVDEKRVYEHQPHDFNAEGVCEDCKYVKAENQKPLEVIVARGQSTATTGTLLTASASVTGGTGIYKYGWTVLFNGEEVYQTDMSMDDEYSYTADQAGSWVFAVTVEDSDSNRVVGYSDAIVVSASTCKHEIISEKTVDTEYERESDAKHKKITVIGLVCDGCGTETSRFNREEYEDHTFVNGTCSGCGLAEPTQECTHENGTETLTSTTYASQGDTKQHVLLQVYTTVCDGCGTTVGTREARTMEDHSFNESGVCGCGYAKPAPECDHADKESVMIGTPVYSNPDEKNHLIEAAYKIVCKGCGITLSESDPEISIEPHTYVDGICACGQREHVHKYEKVVVGKPSYTNLNTSEHSVTTTYYTKCSCGDTTEQVTETVPGEHVLDYTGYESQHPHKVFKRCACGHAEYTGGNQWVSSCSTCNPPKENDYGISDSELSDEFEKDSKEEGTENVIDNEEEIKKQLEEAKRQKLYLQFESVNDYFWNENAKKVTDSIIAHPAQEWLNTTWSALNSFGDETVKLIHNVEDRVRGVKDEKSVYVLKWEDLIIKTLQGYREVALEELNEENNLQESIKDAADALEHHIGVQADRVSRISEIKNKMAHVEWSKLKGTNTTESQGILLNQLFDQSDKAWWKSVKLEVVGECVSGFATLIDSTADFKEDQENLEKFAELLYDYEANMDIINSIKESTTNQQVITACEHVADNLSDLYWDPENYVDKDKWKWFANEASTIVFDAMASLSPFGVISGAASLVDLGGKWNDAHVSGLELQMLSIMDAGIKDEAYRAATNEDHDDYYLTELYRVLQLEGLAQSKDYITKFERAWGLEAEDLGIYNLESYKDAINKTIMQNVEYQDGLLLKHQKSLE